MDSFKQGSSTRNSIDTPFSTRSLLLAVSSQLLKNIIQWWNNLHTSSTANFVYFRATPPRRPVVQRPLCCLPLSSAMSTIALARAPSSALALLPSLASPLPSRPRPPSPVSTSPLASRPLPPPSTTTAIAAVDDDHHRRCRTFDNDIDGGDGGHCRMRRRSMAAVAMASLPPRQRQRLVPSAPCHRRLRQQRPPWMKTAIAAADIDDNDCHCCCERR
jgi:hypothetical protein